MDAWRLFLAQLVGAHGGGVAFRAHVGGFVAGALLVLVFRDPERVVRHPNHGGSP